MESACEHRLEARVFVIVIAIRRLYCRVAIFDEISRLHEQKFRCANCELEPGLRCVVKCAIFWFTYSMRCYML